MTRLPMSEKAKGKQKDTASESQSSSHSSGPATNGPPLPDPLKPRTLTIRFTEGTRDLALVVYPTDTIRDIKKKIRGERPSLQGRRLRLIHSGRLLTDGTLMHGWLIALETRQNRSKPGELLDNDTSGDSASRTTWLHCSVGANMQPEEEEESSSQQAQLQPVRGFDRLASAGFSEEDIATIRRQFHYSRGGGEAETLDDEDADEHARALEEQWIDDMDGANGVIDQSLDGNGVYMDLLQGVTTGFFFAFLPFFFLRQMRPAAFFSDDYEQLERTPSSVFSKRMQMAIVIGLLVNLLLGTLKYLS